MISPTSNFILSLLKCGRKGGCQKDSVLNPSAYISQSSDDGEKSNQIMNSVEIAQNRLLRLLEGCRIKDRRTIESMLESQNLPSINQLAIKVKLIEAWKAKHVENYPTSMA